MTPEQALHDFVEDVLNRRLEDRLYGLIHPSYVDHDPLEGISSDRRGLLELISVLSRIGADLVFSFSGLLAAGDLACARLFGEGPCLSVQGNGSRPLSIASGNFWQHDPYSLEEQSQAPTVVHLAISAVLMIRIARGQIVERWGPISSSWTPWSRVSR
jgi:hypothetical protein